LSFLPSEFGFVSDFEIQISDFHLPLESLMTMHSWVRNLFARPVTRTIRKAPHQLRPALEVLEDRWLPSFAMALPTAVPVEVMGPQGKLVPLDTPGPVGYTPQQLQTAYGLNQVSFGGIKGDGTGQTIALVDAYDNPSFVNSTDPNFDTSSLHIFDQTFGLPDPPSFTKVNENGQAAPLPAPAGGFSVEIALDIEWSHAMAPAARIVLVEANSFGEISTAEVTAGKLASVVSMSFGAPESPTDLSLDSTFQVSGVTYLAAAGDHGAPGIYPAYSPNVVAVGGTSLYNLDANGDYPGTGTNGEVGWSLGSDSYAPSYAGGGGISQLEPEPSYQDSAQSTGYRTIPDISADADPSTGVPVYDPYDAGTVTPWGQIGGTSLATPLMAGMVALADQGRILSGGQTFSSDQVLAALYSLDSSKPSDFHDILYGNNGFNAGPGYDLVTGLGTPNGSQLVPDLAYFGLNSRPTLTSVVVTPSSPSVDQGFTQQFTAMGTFASGVTQNITSSVVWALAMPAVATIDASGLATTHAAGTSAITASLDGVTSPGVTLTSLPLVSIAVTPSNPSVDDGFTQQFTATGTFAGGPAQNLTSLVDWASATPAVATIDASGLATTSAAGTSVITAALDGVTSQGVTLTSLPLVALAVAPNNPYVPVLLSVPFSVTGIYQGGSTHELLSTSVAWASSRPAVAAINSAGLATANAPGTSVITASLDGFTSPGDLLTAVAPTFVVNTTADDLNFTAGKTNLREAILATNAYPGHTVTFDPAVFATAKTIALTLGQLELSDTTGTETIKGPKAGVTISGNNASRVFQVDPNVTASLTGLTISGGSAFNGGGLYNLGTLTLTNCTVSGNSAVIRGGGLYTPYGASGSMTLTNCTVSDNSAGRSGGGLDVFSLAMAVKLTNCTFSGNSSGLNGGGMQVLGTATLMNCNISGNRAAAGVGGGLEVLYDPATLTNCTVRGNSAGDSGGGVVDYDGSLAMRNCTVSGNSGYLGGGVYNYFGTATLTNCTVSGNSGLEGGAVANNGTATLTNSAITGNSASYGGGLLSYGTATLTNSTITGNSANYGGGLFSNGTLALTNCTVSGNSASVNGGGVYVNSGTATLANCTISGNTATGSGGGLQNYSDTGTLTNCTVSGNSARVGGGIDNDHAGTLKASNCTISKNRVTSEGGGIAATSGSVTLTYVTINNNEAVSSALAQGGGIYSANTLVSLTNCTVNANQATGPTAQGGGIYSANSLLSLNNCTVNFNQANGGAGANGSAGGDATGGGLDVALGSTATVTNTAFLGNSAQGGAGGAGADGGGGYGGGIAVTDTSSLSLSSSALLLNSAQGGAGGNGANGGNGEGGGVFVGPDGTATINQTTLSANLALGGDGLSGGNGLGGGIYVAGGASVGVTDSTIVLNAALGGHGHQGGSNGAGIGGGVYSLGTFTFDVDTVIFFNFASTSGDNIGT
jgi:parallel beta-helix repeat protein